MPESRAKRPPRLKVDTRTALRKTCSACKKTIYFAKDPKTRQLVPVDADGTRHFATCSASPTRLLQSGAGTGLTTGKTTHTARMMTCSRCGQRVHVITNLDTERMAVRSEDGSDHRETCPDRKKLPTS